MDLDGQAIERRDFPISRRGYDPAAVDAHLRAIATAFAELQDRAAAGETLGSSAGSQVQSILDAAEQAAAGIVGDAQLGAQRTRQEAERDATRTRGEAIARAERMIAAVQGATEDLQRRLEGMDAQVRELADGLIAATATLGGQLGQAQRATAALFDAGAVSAASGSSDAGAAPDAQGLPAAGVAPEAMGPGDAGVAPEAQRPSDATLVAAEAPGPPAVNGAAPPAFELQPESAIGDAAGGEASSAPAVQETAAPDPLAPDAEGGVRDDSSAGGGGAAAHHARSADLDGARLVALNMALNGESREQTGRYLAESFELEDAEKLLEEVYAAIEG